MNKIKITQLFNQEPLDFMVADMYRSLGVFPETLKREGISVSVAVPSKLWGDDKYWRERNQEAYEEIMSHKDLFTFVSAHGYSSLEEFRDSHYSYKYLWVIIGDRMAMGKNRLVVTSGHAPNRLEAYYRAKNYEEFWSVVQKLTDMLQTPNEEHDPIILKQNNGYCGSSYKEWELSVY